ncbi:hypothetical protein, partial [Nostoc sp. UCD121]|uniref:hypothetical protein n=1 Tax=Nostoc sp. UCD121 TaxID=2681305 RepID=UPI001C890D4B
PEGVPLSPFPLNPQVLVPSLQDAKGGKQATLSISDFFIGCNLDFQIVISTAKYLDFFYVSIY